MENQSRTQIKVGIYIAMGLIATLTSIFFLGADKALFSKSIKVHAHFDQVQGLAQGSIVSLSGVNVGNVKSITFVPEENKLDVTMSIEESYISRVRKDSQVEIRTQGALGDKFVFIFSGSKSKPQVENGDVLEVATPSDLIGVISQRGGEAGKIFDVINEFYKLAYTINADGHVAKIVKNMESASANLATASKDAEALMASFNQNKGQSAQKLFRSIDKFESIINRVDKGEGTLGLLINDPSLHNQVKAFLGGSDRNTHLKNLLRTSIDKDGH